jgi:hypothetical protein
MKYLQIVIKRSPPRWPVIRRPRQTISLASGIPGSNHGRKKVRKIDSYRDFDLRKLPAA